PDSYYLKALYLDALRVIDVLRLRSDLDCGGVGIIGKGLGAAAAVFAAAHSPRVRALVLDTPSFCYLPLNQNHSTSDTAREINEYIAAHRTRKSAVKKNLTYFDALNFSDMIDVPVMATVGFKDTLSPPQCVFALFNHLICDKTIEVYPDEGNSAGGENQFRKSVAWLKKNLG
ncbi:MAG TPA: acetylesterase, partial [Spirochaetes bacterium]|nr:acetylesterase [Spirochaetota bacterium]